ncbi:MAG: hypothetical protein LBT35_01105 [Tannerella sp.]|jgi:hypothetical protein|nr:hypothetical protein [Tannerella sp.]
MIIRKFHSILLLTVLLAAVQAGTSAYAQLPTLVDVKIEVADIMIGEQTVIHLSVTTDRDRQVLVPLPPPGELLTEGVEVLRITPPDTVDIKNNRVSINYDLLITSFDSALYLLPSFIAIDGRDTIRSEQVALKVTPPEVNLDAPDEYYDIKAVWKPPFVLADYYPLIFGILFVLLLAGAAYYYYKRWRRRPARSEGGKRVPLLPPHEQAIKELNEIRERKLWQQSRFKDYYTEITDTLRRYMTARYGFEAMEMTSSEILDLIEEEEKGNKDVLHVLKQILQLSDFVKFAKLHPLPDENDLSMRNANTFVDGTKKVAAVAPTAIAAASDESPQQQTNKEINETI